MSKHSYEVLDLIVFSVIAMAIEALNVFAFNKMEATLSLSFAAVMGMIAIFRWNGYGLVVAVLAGAAGLFTRNALNLTVTPNLWMAYTIGYLGLAVCLLFFIKRNKEDLRNKIPLMIVYFISGYLAVEVMRTICQIGNGDFLNIVKNYFTWDLLNILVGLAVFLIALHQPNLVVDMNTYLINLHSIPEASQVRAAQADVFKLEELAEKDDINDAALLDGGTLSDNDLKQMEETRRKLENKENKFDKENQEIEKYSQSKKSNREAKK
jgi:hypothetical protein